MSNKLIRIDKDNLDLAWHHAAPYLDRVLTETREYFLSDIYNLIKDNVLTLWMFYNEKKKKAFGTMVTQIYELPLKRTLYVLLMAADGFDEVEPLFPSFMEYAKQIRADNIECAGRFGLDKILGKLGFKKSYIVMNIDVN